MVAAAALKLYQLAKGGEKIVDYAAAAASGFIDAYLIDKNALAFVAKNVLIPLADAMVTPLPKGLVYHAIGQLGFVIAALISK